MMAITTRSSISVKPDRAFEFAGGTSKLCERDFILVDLERQLKWLRRDDTLMTLNQCQCMSLLIGLAKTNCFRPEKHVRGKSLQQINGRVDSRERRFFKNACKPIALDRPWPGYAVNPQWRGPRQRECVSAMDPASSGVFQVFLPLVDS